MKTIDTLVTIITRMETNTEIWKPIFGFDGYMVSNLGRVKSLKNGKEMILKPNITRNSYLQTRLVSSVDGKQYRKYIHVLVGEAFIPNDNLFKREINHRDENPQNNNVNNLEWCDRQYNVTYGSRLERVTKRLTNGKRSKAVIQLNLDGTFVKEWPSINEIQRELGFSCGNISRCCNGKHKQVYNFIWQYKYENR